ncbi:hypothetical protein [Malaciobacter mytili]|uniref:hypothetical protein n=1 Tax=Malaciobacter mytili TaxID=603050 RepID=UPI003A85F0F0
MSNFTRINSRYKKRVKELLNNKKEPNRPFAYHFAIKKLDDVYNGDNEIPSSLTFVKPNPTDSSKDLLFLDKTPIHRELWHYDKHDRTLKWSNVFGGGVLHLSHDGTSAVGNIGEVHNFSSVSAGAKATFNCSVALDCGIEYITSGERIEGFSWDPNSDAWKNAQWVQDRLTLTYTVEKKSQMEPPSFSFEFEDNQTLSIPYSPNVPADGYASLTLNDKNQWVLIFKALGKPIEDMPIVKPTGPDSVYPYWMEAYEDMAAMTINGAMQIDDVAPDGQKIGFNGIRANSNAQGYYKTSEEKAPFALFDGKIHIDNQSLKNSRIEGNTLKWNDLDIKYQEKTGLPKDGEINLSRCGSTGICPKNIIKIQRLNTNDAINSIYKHNELHSKAHTNLTLSATNSSSLDITGLLSMSPFVQDSQGAWMDIIQEKVRSDLSEIMNSFMDPSIWKLLFPNQLQPTLTGELAIVANSPVQGVSDPKEWYKSLSTAVLSQGLSSGDDKNCKNLNGPKAEAWLNEQIGKSPVYDAHGQQLFHYEWAQRFPSINLYLADQTDPNNTKKYNDSIDSQLQASINDINNNVLTDSASSSDMKQKMISQVTESANYAKEQNLYWAFYYYTYNTSAAILANIQIQISMNTGSFDGTALSRMIQQNVAVLSALDPSGYFANEYNKTLNTFMTTNILINMYDFNEDSQSIDMMKLYLQTFIDQNINSEVKEIADAAKTIQEMVNEIGAEELLKSSIALANEVASLVNDTLALPYIANGFVAKFSAKYPKWAKVGSVFGGIFMAGLTGLAIFNLVNAYKSWDNLSDKEKDEVIFDTVQFGIQILSAMVQRGVRIYAVWGVEGLTTAQRTGAIFDIAITGMNNSVDGAMIDISNSMAQWIGDTEGSMEMRAEITAIMNIGENDIAAEVSWTAKIFGKNLDEFIATRLGPALIIASIGLSIYFMSQGESGMELASDILNIVSGSLMIFGLVGEWAIAAGYVAAEGVLATIISVAGPLAILAAFVGIGLMLYEMFKTQPDPVEEFVNDYAKPAGFYVSSQFGSIYYAQPYVNCDDNDILMLGFNLSQNENYLLCNDDTSISLGSKSYLPDGVWFVYNNGIGVSQIFTIVPDNNGYQKSVYLTLNADKTISFSKKMDDKSTAITQSWKCDCTGDVSSVCNSQYLKSMSISLSPILPVDKQFDPKNASGYLSLSNGKIIYSMVLSSFILSMSPLAPNYIRMKDMTFLSNSKPNQYQSFSPAYGINPSTPLNYTLSGELPSFLTFHQESGIFNPNGGNSGNPSSTDMKIAVDNSVGNANTAFKVIVK